MMRSPAGNLPNILSRIAAHKKSVGATMSAGLARNHLSNTAAKLRVHAVYCVPVLFSGLASLALSSEGVRIVDRHYQVTIQNLQHLHQKTPRSVVFFLAGCLPGEALLNMRQLSFSE